VKQYQFDSRQTVCQRGVQKCLTRLFITALKQINPDFSYVSAYDTIFFLFGDDRMENRAISHAIFVGDVHLNDRKPEREIAFCRFMDWVLETSPDHVFLMGDIFEFWFGYRYVMFSQVLKPLTKIAQITDAGIPVTYLVGNHDFKPGFVFTNLLRVTVNQEPVRMTLGGQRVYISHGDEINTADRPYMMTRAVYRSKIAQFLFQHFVPVSLAWHIGRVLSDTSRQFTGKREKTIPPEVFNSFCRREIAEGVSLVIHGHNHDPGERVMEMESGTLRLIDTGDWLGDCGHYVEYIDGTFHCKTWPI
jgi:UDP-2,3-diacylglucosamine hydrolase